MKLELHFSNKMFYTLILGGVFVFTVVSVFAAYSFIPNPGHGGDVVWVSVGGNEMSVQEAIESMNQDVVDMKNLIDSGALDSKPVQCRIRAENTCSGTGWCDGNNDPSAVSDWSNVDGSWSEWNSDYITTGTKNENFNVRFSIQCRTVE